MKLEIRELSAENVDDFLYFFDNRAFCDNPDWSGCYCRFFNYSDDELWMKRTPDMNRDEASGAIEEGMMNGFIAYSGDAPVGWCNAGAVESYERIIDDDMIPSDEGLKVGSIVCFVVDHDFRRLGLASALLSAACDKFEKEGFDVIEAYPRKAPASDAENYFGPAGLYRKHGFDIHREYEDFCVVRKTIG